MTQMATPAVLIVPVMLRTQQRRKAGYLIAWPVIGPRSGGSSTIFRAAI
jgi:hypothetical protein